MTHSIPYISRQSAEDLQNSFAKALADPASYPVMFYIWGIGGVGKSRLRIRLRETYCQQADFTEVSFGLTEGINTPIELMAKLYSQLPTLAVWQRDLLAKDPFQALYEQYLQIENQLRTEPIDGKKSVEKEQSDLDKTFFSKVGKFGLNLFLGDRLTPTLEKDIDSTVDLASNIFDQFRQLLQQHGATKKSKELQDLMLEPIPRLTKAFVDSLAQYAKQSDKAIVLVLDTYEKASSDVDLWLCKSLLANTEIHKQKIRLIVAGKQNLSEIEYWQNLQQERNSIKKCQLDRFDYSQTREYLNCIGITSKVEIDVIFAKTKGFPYYLNWIREQPKGKKPNFFQGNKSMLDYFKTGLSDEQKQAVYLGSCCRWFDKQLIKYLQQKTNLRCESNGKDCYEWLSRKLHFVEPLETQECYRLDDVARNLFREDLFHESPKEFYRIHEAIATYFAKKAEKAVSTKEHITEKYKSLEWCTHTKEYLYHISFLSKQDYQEIFLTYLFESHYFQQLDIVQQPVKNISSEANLGLDKYDLLSEKVRRFLSDIKPVIDYGLEIIESEKNNLYLIAIDAFNNELQQFYQYLNIVDDENPNKLSDKSDEEKSIRDVIRDLITDFSTRIPTIRDSLYEQTKLAKDVIFRNNTLEGLAKFVLLIYKARCISDIKDLSLNEASHCAISLNNNNDYKEFSASIFLMLGNTYHILDMYEDACDSYSLAIETKPSHEIFCSMTLSLDIQGKYEEAHDFHSRALTRNRDERVKIVLFFNDIKNLLDLFQSNKKQSFSNYLENRLIQYFPNIKAEYATGIASILSLHGWHDEAISFLNKCLLNNSESYEIWHGKGHIFLQLARNEEAIASYDQALQIKPDTHEVWNNRGIALFNLGRNEEAIASYDQALQIKPDTHKVWNNRGIALFNLRRYEEAISSYDRALEIKSDNHLTCYNRGNSLYKLGRTKMLSIVSSNA